MTLQTDLFQEEPDWPEGFRYAEGLIGVDEQAALVAAIAPLPFRDFEFQGFTGKRRVVSYGARYDFSTRELAEAEPLPPFLHPLRERAAVFAGLAPAALSHALVTECGPGAAIGWHRDKGVFGEVVGVSLLSPCTFRLRLKQGAKWRRVSVIAIPGSAYLLSGPARTEWEHSIPPVDALRYSVTFRTLKG